MTAIKPFVLLVLTFLLLPSKALALFAADTEKVTMQLRWSHQFQFAGYYAAKLQGFYQQRGLDVEIVAGTPNKRPVDEVLAGRATYAEANTELLLHYLKGKNLVALAAVAQHSPSILLTRKDSGIRTPQDLVSKKIMLMGGTEDVDFLAMFAKEGVDSLKLNIIPSSYDINDLINGKVDVFNAYSTNEPFYLTEQNIQPFAIRPVDYGIDFYSDILFTSQQELEQNPERVKAFREASLLGWEYALNNPDEIIDLLINEYGVTKSRAHLEYEAKTMKSLILPDIVPLGNMNPGRFSQMQNALEELGFVQTPSRDLQDFIYEANPSIASSTFWRSMLAALAVITLLSLAIFWFWRNTQQLKHEVRLRQKAQSSLASSEKHFKDIVDNLQVVYYRTDSAGIIQQVSNSAESFFDLSKEDVIGQSMAQFYEPPYKREDFLKALEDNAGQVVDYEIKVKDTHGKLHWISVNSRYVYKDNELVGVEGTFQNITERKLQQLQMKEMAHQDTLTQLANRRALINDMPKAHAQALRHGHQGAILYIDLDDFKPINDRYGHQCGDALLVEIAKKLKSLVRLEDTVYRIGGDEFIILLPVIHPHENNQNSLILGIAQKIIDALQQTFVACDRKVSISCSIGACYFPQDNCDFDKIISMADQAMYRAKQEGKNQIILCEALPSKQA